MSVAAGRPAPPRLRRDSLGTSSSGAGRERPGKGGEFWWWIFMRISGILLLVLVVGHVLIMHVVGRGVDRVDFGFVAVRWHSPFWRSWDWLMLSLALVHGVNGLRVIALDYMRGPGLRIAVNWFFFIAGMAAFALGSVVVFTFDPCRWPGTAGIVCP